MKDINKLVEKVKSNDKKAFEELYRLTASELYWYCRRLCGNDADAEELMQETYLNVWRKIKNYTDVNFTAWIHSIAYHLRLDSLKKQREELYVEEGFDEIADDKIFDPAYQSELNIQREELMKLIDASLSDVQRMTLIMYYYDGKSVGEISAETECSEGTVKSRLYFARKKLYDEIKSKNLCAVSLPLLFRYDAEQEAFSDTLDMLGKSILHKAVFSGMQLPCFLSVFSVIAVAGFTLAVSDIMPSGQKAVDNSEIVIYNTSLTADSSTEDIEITSCEIPISVIEEIFCESENNIEEVSDMNKNVNAIVSGITAAAMLTATAVSTEFSAETAAEFTIRNDTSEQEMIIPEEMPRFETIEDIENYFKANGVDFGSASDEEKQEVFQYLLDIAEFRHSPLNDDESGAETIIWNTAQEYRIGVKYDDYLRYVVHDNEVYISGSNEICEVTEYVIPDKIDGMPVAAIGGGAFTNFKNLEKITIPNTVRRIGAYAFHNLGNLKEIDISHPDEHSDIQTIGRYAFYHTALENVNCFENSDLAEIKNNAFCVLESITEFGFPDNKVKIADNAFCSCTEMYKNFIENGRIVIPSKLMEAELEQLEESSDNIRNDITDNWEKWKIQRAYDNLLYTLYLSPYYTDGLETEFTDKDFIKLKGDIDFDGEISIKDLALLKMYLIGEAELEPMQKLSVSSDNTISNIDIRSVARLSNIIVGLEN